eukprot:2596897-Prymnesium_polylepis.2
MQASPSDTRAVGRLETGEGLLEFSERGTERLHSGLADWPVSTADRRRREASECGELTPPRTADSDS